MRRGSILLLGVAVALAGGPAVAAARRPPPASDFVRLVDNPWFPLRPGTTLRYRGEQDGVPGTEVFTVTRRHRTILGVRTTIVHDRVFERGRLQEDTFDFYAQDRRGVVWYFGEDTKELDRHGHVTTREGTWHAGVDGAQPGIFMPAHPAVGRSFRQEFLKGTAEDHFRIVSLHATVRVPGVVSRRALETREWSPLEPGVRDQKLYVRGIGTVLERTLRGGDERWQLVSIERPRRARVYEPSARPY